MPQPFAITPDLVRPLIHVRLSGFWSTDIVDRYGVALMTAVDARLARSSRPFFILVDARGYPVQSAEVRQRFSQLQPNWPPMGSGPLKGLVILANATLDKTLVKTALGGMARIWADPAEAMSWIDRELAAIGSGHDDGQPSRTGSIA